MNLLLLDFYLRMEFLSMKLMQEKNVQVKMMVMKKKMRREISTLFKDEEAREIRDTNIFIQRILQKLKKKKNRFVILLSYVRMTKRVDIKLLVLIVKCQLFFFFFLRFSTPSMKNKMNFFFQQVD